jgi:hypothetical protein
LQHWVTPAPIAFLCRALWAFLPKLAPRHIEPGSTLVYDALADFMVEPVLCSPH